MARITIATIKPGTTVKTGYRNRNWSPSTFLGFGTDNETASFPSLAQLRSNVADEDAHRALFRDEEGDFIWAAYRYNGRWVVGSSADRLQLAA